MIHRELLMLHGGAAVTWPLTYVTGASQEGLS